MTVLHYDEYFDIPLRGIVQTASGLRAFTAREIEEEPAEIEGRPGIYSRMRLFPCDDTLRAQMEEKGALFAKWRARFDQGLEKTESHPLVVDRRYKALSKRIGEAFNRLGRPLRELNGLMHVVAGEWTFEPL